MSPAAKQKVRRDRARAQGLCGQCCKRPALSGEFRCEHCKPIHLAGVKRVYEQRSVKEWCDECIAGGFHRVGCSRRRAA